MKTQTIHFYGSEGYDTNYARAEALVQEYLHIPVYVDTLVYQNDELLLTYGGISGIVSDGRTMGRIIYGEPKQWANTGTNDWKINFNAGVNHPDYEVFYRIYSDERMKDKDFLEAFEKKMIGKLIQEFGEEVNRNVRR